MRLGEAYRLDDGERFSTWLRKGVDDDGGAGSGQERLQDEVEDEEVKRSRRRRRAAEAARTMAREKTRRAGRTLRGAAKTNLAATWADDDECACYQLSLSSAPEEVGRDGERARDVNASYMLAVKQLCLGRRRWPAAE